MLLTLSPVEWYPTLVLMRREKNPGLVGWSVWTQKEWAPGGIAPNPASAGTISSVNSDFKWASRTPWVIIDVGWKSEWCLLFADSSGWPKGEMMEPSLTYSLILFCCCSLRRYAGRLISVNCCFTMEISNQTRAALTAEESLKFSDRFWTGFGGNRDKISESGWGIRDGFSWMSWWIRIGPVKKGVEGGRPWASMIWFCEPSTPGIVQNAVQQPCRALVGESWEMSGAERQRPDYK